MPLEYYQMYQEHGPEIIFEIKLPNDPLVRETVIEKFEFLQELQT